MELLANITDVVTTVAGVLFFFTSILAAARSNFLGAIYHVLLAIFLFGVIS